MVLKDFIVIIDHELGISPHDLKENLYEVYKSTTNNTRWSPPDAVINIAVFDFERDQIPLSEKCLSTHERSPSPVTTWTKRGRGWTPDIWLEVQVIKIINKYSHEKGETIKDTSEAREVVEAIAEKVYSTSTKLVDPTSEKDERLSML